MICVGDLPFALDDYDIAVEKWRSIGYPPIHHSDTFRPEYRPAYRVISSIFLKELPNL